jgi:ubiquinone/menaquinone biosynthesis C-methylase UbiE
MTESEICSESDYISEQYRTSDNLRVRILTHERYSHPKVDFREWILDQVPWTGREITFDLGCGSGTYAESASRRSRRYIAGDFSYGMLTDLPDSVVTRLNLDAAALPLVGESVDVVLANHMLYHVPNLKRAIVETHRVLKPGGILFAATNSEMYMPELWELQVRLASKLGVKNFERRENPFGIATRFTLENGRQALSSVYANVERRDLPGALVFEEASPLVAYLESMRDRFALMYAPQFSWKEIAAALRDEIDQEIAKNGVFRVTKLAGVFICGKETKVSRG